MEDQTAPLAPFTPMKDLRYYAKWWCALHGSMIFLSQIGATEGFSSLPVALALLAVIAYGWAFFEAVVFTFLQNVFNQKRWKALSWLFAIAIIVAEAVLGATLRT